MNDLNVVKLLKLTLIKDLINTLLYGISASSIRCAYILATEDREELYKSTLWLH